MTDQKFEELVLYKLGIWIAEPGKDEFYSPGGIYIKAKKDERFKVPKFLGEGDIPEKENLLQLIDVVSQEMIKSLSCDKVYCVSLGESEDYHLHFRLFPRYRDDQGILDELDSEIKDTNDGLVLMARWRRQFLLKKCTNGKFYKDLHNKHKVAIEKVREALHKRAINE